MNQMLFPYNLPPAPKPTGPARVTFTGRRADFGKMVLRGTLLELVTVGFYRFWLATDMRRHLWSNTAVDGDAAEYTGTAKELLIGFLFALAILAPIYLAYFLVGLEAERFKAFASFPLVVFFYLFAQFAIYRARRYRLTRTVWRGVRFWMTGSGWSYAWRAGLWMLFSLITLGIAMPWAKASLERYKMRHTSYGDLQGRFDGTGGGLFRKVWWLWLLMWPSALFVIPIPFIYAALRAIEWRWWVDGLRIGEVRFSSDLASDAFMGLYWKVIGWCSLLFVGFLASVGTAFFVGYLSLGANLSDEQRFLMATQQLPFVLTLGVAYVVSALTLGFVIRIYLMRDLWQRVAASVTVSNLESGENVTAQGELVGALGEGFANSLDVAGF